VEITTVGWVLTIGVIAALLAFDLLLATLRPHAVGYPEATLWSVLYIAAAVAFGLVFASIVGWRYGAEYFAGYLVEKSLSVDNLFVFVIIMATFAVPREHQQRVLTYCPGSRGSHHRQQGTERLRGSGSSRWLTGLVRLPL
jgi:tellurite resistance protein TerC